MPKKYTINDVAREAGVSNATVSLVLSGKGKISEEKKKLVLETIERLGYKRQRSYSSPKIKERNLVGLVVFCDFPFQWWFASEFISEMETRLFNQGFYTIVFRCDQDTDQQLLLEKVVNAGLQGLIVLHYNEREFFSRIVSQNLPLVIVNNSNFQNDFNTVCSDDFQGAYEGTKRLIDSGHKHIKYLDYPRPKQPGTVADRFYGFRKAMEEADINFSDEDRIQVELNDELGLDEAIRDKIIKTKTTGIFVHDDYLAARLVRALKMHGLSIPEDFSIVAPGDSLPYDEPFIPQISTMQVNRKSMGKLSVDMLLSILRNPDRPKQVVKTIEEYVDRGSCIAYPKT